MTIRRVSLFAFAFALAGLLALPTGAQAQERTPMGGQASFTNLIDALNNTEAQVRALEQQSVQEVHLANIQELRQGLDESQKQELDQALEEANTEELKNAVSENEEITSALEEDAEEELSAENVVAVDANGEGGVVVYYDPEK